MLRCFTVVSTAQALQEISRLFDQSRYGEALAVAQKARQEVVRVAALTDDKTLMELADTLTKHTTTLQQAQQT
ncbi:MAG TPA: hypothetical protein EYH31_05405 [Anaerolineae bacterium]|nr:hypothetical protein [Anaerolineae bacterium]